MNWQTMLPASMELPSGVARELEAFRASIGCPDDAFAMRIIGSRWGTRRTQRLTYDRARSEDPTATEDELVQMVYETRKLSAQMTGQAMPPLPASCRTFDALVEFLVTTESRNALPDPYGWGAKIDSILEKAT